MELPSRPREHGEGPKPGGRSARPCSDAGSQVHHTNTHSETGLIRYIILFSTESPRVLVAPNLVMPDYHKTNHFRLPFANKLKLLKCSAVVMFFPFRRLLPFLHQAATPMSATPLSRATRTARVKEKEAVPSV